MCCAADHGGLGRSARLARRATTGQADTAGWTWANHGAYALKGLEAPLELVEVTEGAPRAPEGRFEPQTRRARGPLLGLLGLVVLVGLVLTWLGRPQQRTGSWHVLTASGWTAIDTPTAALEPVFQVY